MVVKLTSISGSEVLLDGESQENDGEQSSAP
jgi:hypothetical protein